MAALEDEEPMEEEEPEAEEAQIPDTLKGLRACMVCSLIKSFEQFYADGCDNCDPFMPLKERQDRVSENTSPYFEGMVAMIKPEQSWVAKWQRISNLKPGVYAMEVTGMLPETTKEYLEDRGINILAKPP